MVGGESACAHSNTLPYFDPDISFRPLVMGMIASGLGLVAPPTRLDSLLPLALIPSATLALGM